MKSSPIEQIERRKHRRKRVEHLLSCRRAALRTRAEVTVDELNTELKRIDEELWRYGVVAGVIQE